MKNRMSRCAALIGTVLSLSSFAQECEEISLYKNGNEIEKMGVYNRTFPESPEWSANWGPLGEMIPPYIRLSGQKDKAGDWTGEFVLSKMPVKVQGGNLKLKLRATQNSSALIWLAGDFGKSSTRQVQMEANRTYSLNIPVADLLGTGANLISRVGIGLKDVPAYQYTTLFVDDVSFTCGFTDMLAGSSSNGSTEVNNQQDVAVGYAYSDIGPEITIREGKYLEPVTQPTTAAYNKVRRTLLADSTDLNFVVTPMEQMQIRNYTKATNLSAHESSNGWFRSLYLVDRNRLKENAIANPKALFYEARAFATGSDNKETPLLIGNVDYGYKVCLDSLCDNQKIVPGRLLLAGLPIESSRGSVIRLYYDPYFVTTNRKSFPTVEIYADGSWKRLLPKSDLEIRFESAGKQKIQVRLSEGDLTVNQNLFVEVK